MKKKLNNNQKDKFITPFNESLSFVKTSLKETPSLRNTKTVVKTAKNRKISSTLWLQRQLNDIYVKKAKIDGYCSRAAYKLLEINKKFNLLKPNTKIVDLGAAPGGWTQVVSKLLNKKGLIVAVDLLPLKVTLENVIILQGDFLKEETVTQVKNSLNGKADVVLSDMAPNTTGSKDLDHLRILALIEMAIKFSKQVLVQNGSLVIKVFQGGLEQELFKQIYSSFKEVKYFKPNACRKESKEVYLVAKYFT